MCVYVRMFVCLHMLILITSLFSLDKMKLLHCGAPFSLTTAAAASRQHPHKRTVVYKLRLPLVRLKEVPRSIFNSNALTFIANDRQRRTATAEASRRAELKPLMGR